MLKNLIHGNLLAGHKLVDHGHNIAKTLEITLHDPKNLILWIMILFFQLLLFFYTVGKYSHRA